MSYVITDIYDYLVESGITESVYCGYRPNTTENSIFVIDRGGNTENWSEIRIVDFQVFIKTTSQDAGDNLVREIRDILNIRNKQLGDYSYYYFYILENSGGYLGTDENGFNLFSLNFRCKLKNGTEPIVIETGNPMGLLLSLTYSV